jgi:D-proline reductase (dithiol) PrdB
MPDSPITHRSFISYIDRTREFYAAQGYERPYRWARHGAVPFARPGKPLSESRITVITTASPFDEGDSRDGVLRGTKQVWSGEMTTTPDRLYTDDLAWDKDNTHTNDVESFLPLEALRSFVAQGRIGSLAQRFHGVPTDYSQRRTIEQDAPEIVSRCLEDGADIALLVPI